MTVKVSELTLVQKRALVVPLNSFNWLHDILDKQVHFPNMKGRDTAFSWLKIFTIGLLIISYPTFNLWKCVSKCLPWTTGGASSRKILNI